MIKLIVSLVIVISIISLYACVVAGAKADEAMHKYFEGYEDK